MRTGLPKGNTSSQLGTQYVVFSTRILSAHLECRHNSKYANEHPRNDHNILSEKNILKAEIAPVWAR